MEMRTVIIKGASYHEVPDTDNTRSCIGCVGSSTTGEGICNALPRGCSHRDTQWRRTQEQPPLGLKRLPYFLTLYVPNSRHSTELQSTLTAAAGGSTRSSGVGEYIMKDGKKCEEFVTKVTVFFDQTQRAAVVKATHDYIRYLLESGEESVLVESSEGTGLYTK